MIPAKYTCKGDDINPEIHFSDIPEDAKSLALIVEDPDAPSGMWVHWVLYNMSPNIQFIKEHSRPGNAVEGMTSFDKKGYGGPCPPSGTHRYFFRLYALDEVLDIPEEMADKDMVEEAMKGHILAQAELMGTFTSS